MDHDYSLRLHELRKRAMRIRKYVSADTLNAFGFFSTNLTQFLPCVPLSVHLRLFRETHYHLWASHLDQAYFGGVLPVAIHGWDGAWVDEIRNRPGMICTMHTGSYRLASYLLAQARIPHALLVSRRTLQKQGDEIEAVLGRLAIDRPIPIIEAEHPSSALSILRGLRNGVSMLAYADGFEGGRVHDHAKLTKVVFLGQHLLVRKGLPYLAYRAGVPLYPMLNFRRDDGTIQVYQSQPLLPTGYTLERFVSSSLQYLFDLLGSKVIHYPEQWEGWFYLHEHIALSQRMPHREGVAAKRPFALLRLDGNRYLLNRQTYEITSLFR